MLHVLLYGQVVGDLAGTGNRLRLLYNSQALENPSQTPLSVGMPTTSPRWRAHVLLPWLRGLFPDRPGVLNGWRSQFGITNLNPESLLEHVGEDLAGAAQFVRPDRLDVVLERVGSLVDLSDEQLESLVAATIRDSLPYDPQSRTGRFSLAGAQSKFALQRTSTGWAMPQGAEPSTHIFKPAIPGLEDQDLTEVISMRVAGLLGLPVPQVGLINMGRYRVFVTQRYDRIQTADGWQRIHQEDFCQALGVNPDLKYESQGGPGICECAALLRQNCPDSDTDTFARAVIFNYLVRGSDAHAKNYSLMLTPGRVRLAPLYDLNTTLTFGTDWAEEMAMRIGGENRFSQIGAAHWELFAKDLGLETDAIREMLQTMSADLVDAIASVAAQDDIAGIAPQTIATLKDRAADWLRTVARRSIAS